jgi:hypothetical protein
MRVLMKKKNRTGSINSIATLSLGFVVAVCWVLGYGMGLMW